MVSILVGNIFHTQLDINLRSPKAQMSIPEIKVSLNHLICYSSIQEIAYNLSILARDPNPSIVLLITILSLLTYLFFPAIFFDLAGKAGVLFYARISGNY